MDSASRRFLPWVVALALLVPVGRLAVLRAFPREAFLTVMAFIVIPASIGPLIGPALGGLLVHYVSWH